MTLEPLCTAGRPPRPLHTSTQADTARLQLRQSQPGSTTRLQPGTDRQRHYHQHSKIQPHTALHPIQRTLRNMQIQLLHCMDICLP